MPNRVGANGATIVPGDSAGSRLYLKLIGNQAGLQMPPTGPLSPEQIGVIKAWIDQGAEWPDDASGGTPSPADQKAARMMEALRNGDRHAFKKMLRADPKAANLKGPGGSTPLMYASLYGDSDSVRLLLKSGADPNIRNDAGAAALMWAVDDLEKSRLLLEHGANANARSEYGQTPLIIAAGRLGSGPVVKLLLDHGANPSEKAPNGETPLLAAASTGDEATLGMLLDHGSDVKSAGPEAPALAARVGCGGCFDRLIRTADRDWLSRLVVPAALSGNSFALKTLLDRGADVNTKGFEALTALTATAALETVPVETARDLIGRGADLDAKDAHGLTALDLAKRLGATPMVDLLLKAGAKEGGTPLEPVLKPKPAGSARAAIERSLPLLQRADVTFLKKAGCVSCHNNNLAAMAVAAARKKAIAVDEETARKQLQAIASYMESWRERLIQGIGIPGNQDTVSYILLGMAAENYPPDPATDASARYLKSRQVPDGHWRVLGHFRPPLESSDIEVTAVSMRAIQVYAPNAQRAEYEKAVQLAAGWLVKAQPKTNEDRAFRLLGLGWSRASREPIQRAARDLLAQQRPDGGWAQLPWLASDAYATGQALVALKESGALEVTAPAYQRGNHFLMNTQLEDGSWYVKSRAIPLQPYFESDFPHGHDQWISAAATNWAVMALAEVGNVSKSHPAD